MRGFFETQPTVNRPHSLIAKCGACGLYKKCDSPKIPVTGEGRRRILVVGESPGCLVGDTRIETAFRDKTKSPNGVPIRDLVGLRDFYVYSFDVEKQRLVLGRVLRVWKTGRKQVFRITYRWRDYQHNVLENSITATSNHPFLLKRRIAHDPFGGNPDNLTYVSVDTGLEIGHGLQPFYRGNYEYCHVGSTYKDRQKESRLLLEFKLGRGLVGDEECHHINENKWDDRWSNLELLDTASHARLHMSQGNPMDDPSVRAKHAKVMASEGYRNAMSTRMKAILEDPEVYARRLQEVAGCKDKIAATVRAKFSTDPGYYYRYLLGRQRCTAMNSARLEVLFRGRFPDVPFPPEDNHRVVAIERVGVEDVFDLEVEHYHNFAANGVFVHNSTEDEQGRPFVGRSGQRLQRTLRELGADLFDDCWVTNAVICRPSERGRNRKPTPAEIDYCRPNVLAAIRELDPVVIVLLGGVAVRSVLGPIWKDDPGGIEQWAGWRIPCHKPNAWICPTYHPSYIGRLETEKSRENPVPQMFFKRHLEAALSLGGRPWPEGPPNFAEQVEIVLDDAQAARTLRKMRERGGPVAWDIETDFLKPDTVGASIVCCSVCWQGKKTIAYPWFGEARKATIELLESAVPKRGWNSKFEHRYLQAVEGVEVRNWVWDGMLAAHSLDNRSEITGLKFQAFVQLGVPPYNTKVEPYLKSGGSNERNRIREANLRELMLYCGLDALFEYKVGSMQMELMGASSC